MSKKKILARILFVFVLIITIGGCATWGYYDAVLDFFKTSAEGKINHDNDGELLSDDEIVNILVVGSDRRSNENASERSDSTMIATVDMKTKKLKVTSLMRDMYINIPGHGMDKFNSSFAYGGVELLAETITKNFGIKLDGYLIVDFSSFRKVINKIGGVDITLTQKEVDYLNNTGSRDTGFILKEKYRTVKKGKNTLNGSQALAYSRIRKVTNPKLGDGDFGRCMRQQYVLQQILNKVKDESLTSILNIATSMMSDVSTDLTSSTIQKLVRTVMGLDTKKFESLRLPYEGTYLMGRRNGMFVFIINLDANKAKLQNFIYNKGKDDADYSTDFGSISEVVDDGSKLTDSAEEEAKIYSTHATNRTPATSAKATGTVATTAARKTTQTTTASKTTAERHTTETPTTEHHTTEAPTTEHHTTEAPRPTTEAPKPTTEAPRPTTEAPKPTTEAPKQDDTPSDDGGENE